MGVVVNGAGSNGDIVTSQRISDIFRLLLITGVLYELEMMTLFFVKISEQS